MSTARVSRLHSLRQRATTTNQPTTPADARPHSHATSHYSQTDSVSTPETDILQSAYYTRLTCRITLSTARTTLYSPSHVRVHVSSIHTSSRERRRSQSKASRGYYHFSTRSHYHTTARWYP